MSLRSAEEGGAARNGAEEGEALKGRKGGRKGGRNGRAIEK
jgi:hypothetical protein